MSSIYDRALENVDALENLLFEVKMGIPQAKKFLREHAMRIFRFIIGKNFNNQYESSFNCEVIQMLVDKNYVKMLFGNERFIKENLYANDPVLGLQQTRIIENALMLAMSDESAEILFTSGIIDAILSHKETQSIYNAALLKQVLELILSEPYGDGTVAFYYPIPEEHKEGALRAFFNYLQKYAPVELLNEQMFDEMIVTANQFGNYELQLELMREKQRITGIDGAESIPDKFNL